MYLIKTLSFNFEPYNKFKCDDMSISLKNVFFPNLSILSLDKALNILNKEKKIKTQN